jgi:hypothetical protein
MEPILPSPLLARSRPGEPSVLCAIRGRSQGPGPNPRPAALVRAWVDPHDTPQAGAPVEAAGRFPWVLSRYRAAMGQSPRLATQTPCRGALDLRSQGPPLPLPASRRHGPAPCCPRGQMWVIHPLFEGGRHPSRTAAA